MKEGLKGRKTKAYYMRQSYNGPAENRAHSTIRQVSKKHPLIREETCFGGWANITIQQLRKVSQKRQEEAKK